MFELLVKFDGQSCRVAVEAAWTVGRLKREFARCHSDDGLKPSDIEVIFCGKKLADELILQDCELQETSTVFATRKRSPRRCDDDTSSMPRMDRPPEGRPEVYRSLSADMADLEPQAIQGIMMSDKAGSHEQETSTPNTRKKKPQIYVYCKSSSCHSIKAGKLRVCCRTCRGGTFVVHQDPSRWEDVLTPFRISGVCQSVGCSGTTAEFYFKCGSHRTSDDDRAVALDLIKCNTRNVVCLTCGDVRDPVLVFPCPARHTICSECFAEYCQVQLDERRFTADVGCPGSLIKETHHFRILGNEQYARYQRFGAEECLLQGGGVLCPAPGCGAGLVPDSGSRRVECVQQAGHGCGLVFCRECRNPYHPGDCDTTVAQPVTDGGGDAYTVSTERAAQAQWELSQSRETIRQTTKPCPKCKAPVEKSGGCMHMVCAVQQCKFEWCWVCCIEWNHQCMADHWFDVNR